MRNNRRNKAVAKVAGHPKSSCKQSRLVTRGVCETLFTPQEDYEHLLSSSSVESSPPTEPICKEYTAVM